ncbi:MAG: hypothetical protein JXR70_19275 [Spirochaetales bacterium]|nr:hypothetical protein [Spirochaetales bacterium]
MFTTSLFSALKPKASDLNTTDLLSFSTSALYSGDAVLVKEAYDAVEKKLESDPNNADLNYVGGELAIKLSGVFDMTLATTNPEAYLQNIVNNLDYLKEAGSYFEAAAEYEAALTPQDYVLGGVGLLLAATSASDLNGLSSFDFNNPAPGAQEEAVDFIMTGIDSMGEADAAYWSDFLGLNI